MKYLSYKPCSGGKSKAEIQTEALLRIREIDREMEALLGMDESDSTERLLQSNALLEEIDAIYLKAYRSEVREIYANINAIHTSEYSPQAKEILLKMEETSLYRLYNRISGIKLSQEEEIRLENLHRELENINRSKALNGETIRKVESLLDEKEMIALQLVAVH